MLGIGYCFEADKDKKDQVEKKVIDEDEDVGVQMSKDVEVIDPGCFMPNIEIVGGRYGNGILGRFANKREF